MSLNIPDFSLFFVKKLQPHPWKKSPSLSQQSLSKNRVPVKPSPSFWKFGRRFNSPPPKGGAHYASFHSGLRERCKLRTKAVVDISRGGSFGSCYALGNELLGGEMGMRGNYESTEKDCLRESCLYLIKQYQKLYTKNRMIVDRKKTLHELEPIEHMNKNHQLFKEKSLVQKEVSPEHKLSDHSDINRIIQIN